MPADLFHNNPGSVDISMHHQVIIIGSGFGGQCAAINLRKNGIDDFLILERRSFMGGTWCQNTYPGAAVDVQSPLYSIESEPYDWSQMFAGQDELKEYTNYVIDKHGLREKTRTDANVSKIEWNSQEQLWEVTVNDEAPLKARFVINASGPLSTPVIPEFPGRIRSVESHFTPTTGTTLMISVVNGLQSSAAEPVLLRSFLKLHPKPNT